MLAAGTTVWGPLFVIGVLVALILVAYVLTNMWRKFATNVEKADRVGGPAPSWTNPVIVTVVVLGLYVVGLTLGWNVLQDVTTNISTYKSPAEVAEEKRVKEAQLPTKEEMDKTRQELKERAEVKPHQTAIESFDEKMKREAEKIKQRSLGTTQSATQPVSVEKQ